MKPNFLKLITSLSCCYILLVGCTSSETTTSATATTESDNIPNTTLQNTEATNGTTATTESTRTQVSVDNKIGSKNNLVALVQQNPDLSILLDLIRTAGLVVALENPIQHTFFAPANSAFSALPAGTLEALKRPESKMELTRLLQAHLVPGTVTAGAMTDKMQLETAQGDKIQVAKNGDELRVAGAAILTADVQASNGVIHVVDHVLVPPKK